MWWQFFVTGGVAGIASGMFGIGGGLIIVPALVYLFGMDQLTASGTSLVALLLPVGAFAVWNYWQAGKIGTNHLQWGVILALGLTVGAYLGSKIAMEMSPVLLRRLFAGFMMIAAMRMMFVE